MTREEFVKQRCELDKITEEEFEKTYRVVDCNCGALYCKGYRCLDLDDLLKENQELKKQLEEKDILIKQCDLSVSKVMDCYCERTDCSGRIKDSKQYDSLVQKVENQQQEFIKYLEEEIKMLEKDILETIDDMDIYMKQVKLLIIEEILQKYKEIIGVLDENKTTI